MLDQLGRLVHLEVDFEVHDAQRQPSEVVVVVVVVVVGPVLAGVRVYRLDRAPVARYAAGDVLRGGVQRDQRLESVWRPGNALLDLRGRIFRRQPARDETPAGRRWFSQAVDAECAPVLAATIPGDQIPAATMVDAQGSTSRRLSVPSRLR
jgi:hypothetical protein